MGPVEPISSFNRLGFIDSVDLELFMASHDRRRVIQTDQYTAYYLVWQLDYLIDVDELVKNMPHHIL